jgi:hypothetical protein
VFARTQLPGERVPDIAKPANDDVITQPGNAHLLEAPDR